MYSKDMSRLTIELHQPRVFWRKVATVTIALLVLEPLLYFKLYIPSMIYLAAILAMHVIFLYVYVSHVPWRLLWADKRALLARAIGILTVGYLLTLVHTSPSLLVIFANIIAMSVLHGFILLLLMLKTVRVIA